MMTLEEAKQKHKNFEFIGTLFKFKNKTLIRAKHLALQDLLHYYCFEEDFFWQSNAYGESDMADEIPDFFIWNA